MALSGTIYGSIIGGGYRLEIDWSATQSVADNQSTITAKVYWHSLGSSYTINSGATKSGSTSIDGTSSSYSVDGAGLGGNQRRLIDTYSKTVSHDSNGNKTLTISSTFSCEVTLGGNYYGSTSASDSVTLNSIPRESSLTSSPSWTAGNSLTFTIDRKNSGYTHTIDIKVNNVLIKTLTGIGTSYTYTFTTAENESIFKELAKDTTNWNQATSIVLTTKSGSTTIGSSKTYTGTCSSPSANSIVGSNFTIGNATTLTISKSNSSFVSTVTAKLGSFTKTILTTSSSTSISWNTNDDYSSLLTQLPLSNSGTVTYTITTYWVNGASYTKVRSATTKTVTANVDATKESPTFSGGMVYKDTNPTIVAITGNDQYLVQGKSSVRITLPSTNLASAKSGTAMKEYQAILNGKTLVVAQPDIPADIVFDFTASDLSSATDVTLVVRAVDKRSNFSSSSITLKILPYSPPTATVTAARSNGFDSDTIITLSGTLSPLTVDDINRNSVVSMQYQCRVSGGSYGALVSFTEDTYAIFPNYAAYDRTVNLDNASAWDIQVIISDELGSISVTKSVGAGKPLVFFDSVKKSVGINRFPIGNALEVEGGPTKLYDGYLNFNGTALVSADNSANGDLTGTNFDHIWHDDNTNTWHFCSDTTYKNTGNSKIQAGQLTISRSFGQSVSLNDLDYVAGTNGMYNYIGFNDSTGNWQAYVGFNSSRNNTLTLYNTIGDIRLRVSMANQVVMETDTVTINPNISGTNTGLEIGCQSSSVATYSFIDFHSSSSSLPDYDTRIMSYGGNSTTGKGDLSFIANSFTFTGVGTTASAGNAYLDSNNKLLKSTSSIKYKKDVEDLWENEYTKVLDLRPVYYRSKSDNDRPDWSYVGLIAEEVAEVEPRLVHYKYSYVDDGNGNLIPTGDLEPDGVQYDRLPVYLLALVQRQQRDIDYLKNKLSNR